MPPGVREGGPESHKVGSLKRRLPSVCLAHLSASSEAQEPAPWTSRLILKNLNADLTVHILATVCGNNTENPIETTSVPAGAATMQLIPVSLPGDAPPLYARPVFQDPTLAQNENHPLAQDLPFGWEFASNCDQVIIDIAIDPALFGGTLLNGRIMVLVDIQYDGAWWDTQAIHFAISQVNLTPAEALTIPTGGD